VNSSPTPDSEGDRRVTSVFAELQVPVFENLDVQLALRHEKFSDISKDATVGKFAFGYRPFEMLLIRGSWSEAFRVPNLVTVNEGIVARRNTRTDWACENANDLSGEVYDLDCVNSIQRVASGSDQLVPETSTNTSIGFVLEPLDGLTLTVDFWEIEKDDTIGLFGEENHTLLDLVQRIEAGLGNCAQGFNTNVERLDPNDDQIAAYTEAGICPAGDIDRVNDSYENLDTRTVKGFDIGVYYDVDTDFGSFTFSYNGAFLDTFEQTASGDAQVLVAAQESGLLPASYPVTGFADLVGRDGNQDERHSARLSWRYGDFGAALGAYRVGSFYQSSLTLDDGTQYTVPAFTTYDLTADYRFDVMETGVRLRLGVKNFTDERAPLTDSYFGFFSDAHTDLGRYMYADVRLSF
jgi:outer membrane receptor protein involved in Fe transport